jgi:tight adherence protein B
MLMATVFGAIFAAVALLLLAFTAASAGRTKRTVDRLEAIQRGRPERVEPQAPLDVRIVDTFSSIPWLDRLLHRVNLAPQLRLLLRQADLKWSVGRLTLLCILTGLGCGYLVDLRTHAVFLALVTIVAAGACPMLYVLQKRKSRFDRIRTQLPDAIDLMVAGIRAGHSLNSAMGMVSKEASEPVRGEFRQCVDEQNYGLELRTAMANLIHRVPIHDIRIISAGILVQKDAGGNLAEILEKVGYLIREDFRLQRQVGVHTAQGRLTGYILAALPVGLGFAMYMLNPTQMSLLWTTALGTKMLYGSVVLTAVGMFIIRKIVRIRV